MGSDRKIESLSALWRRAGQSPLVAGLTDYRLSTIAPWLFAGDAVGLGLATSVGVMARQQLSAFPTASAKLTPLLSSDVVLVIANSSTKNKPTPNNTINASDRLAKAIIAGSFSRSGEICIARLRRRADTKESIADIRTSLLNEEGAAMPRDAMGRNGQWAMRRRGELHTLLTTAQNRRGRAIVLNEIIGAPSFSPYQDGINRRVAASPARRFARSPLRG